jgi:hypothetical protein
MYSNAPLSGFAKSLLEVGDDFERAIQAAPQKGAAVVDAEAALKTLVEGTTISLDARPYSLLYKAIFTEINRHKHFVLKSS